MVLSCKEDNSKFSSLENVFDTYQVTRGGQKFIHLEFSITKLVAGCRNLYSNNYLNSFISFFFFATNE